MENWINYFGIGGGTGFIASILTWLRVRARYENKVDNLCKDLEGIKKRVRFSDVCHEIVTRIEGRLTSIEIIQRETQQDIKELLKRNIQKNKNQ